ncbi:MAG: DUF2309 domain-containing protein [Cytophagales bacterium]|nr:MAG: DUF2309 domain-containing protein [Cytophagales bacterium]
MVKYMTFPKYEEEVVLQHLHHYLPHQNPLKDFINDNVLKPFQDLPFHEALATASVLFGYKTYSSLDNYRKLYQEGKINPQILKKIAIEHQGADEWERWQDKLLKKEYDTNWRNRLGQLHQVWIHQCHLNIEKEIHSFLFRFVGSYIDQGIAIQKFPVLNKGFLGAIKELEKHSFIKIFKSKRVRHLLLQTHCNIGDLLAILVGDEQWYEQYLFDQQFAHAGWSGMVAVLEKHPETLFDKRKISLADFIVFELLLEIDALDKKFGEGKWKPISYYINADIKSPEHEEIELLFAPVEKKELFEVYSIWQEAYEWTFYDQALKGLQLAPAKNQLQKEYNFQSVFCIDERECSFRRYVEKLDKAQTFGTAGFFNMEFYFQPEYSKFYAKSCPAPLTPKYIVRETEIRKHHHQKDAVFSKQSKNLFGGWLISQTMGFWSAIQLVWNIFQPSETPALMSSFRHMDKESKLLMECDSEHPQKVDDLQVGFTVLEMANRMEGLLRSIGLINHFSDLVYLVGHGASSVNNTHYAAYGCGACSGQTGSVNARVAATIGNKPEVRAILEERGIAIPITTQFVGALHDTTRDEIDFYDIDKLSEKNKAAHQHNKLTFEKALALNAKERSRRFLLVDSHKSAAEVHKEVKLRSLSLFEPRPEWDHATNAMCIVGRRSLSEHLFLDRRSFLNSYNYAQDPEGKYLLGILRAVAPVCGGINLQYYFACTDQYRLSAGSKLPHNVMGLVGVANGMDGDLRIGLPQQAVNIHDPIRLIVVVEHFPEVVLQTIQKEAPTYQWFLNSWVHLVVIQPETKQLYRFTDGSWTPYQPITESLPSTNDLESILINTSENLPIYFLEQNPV